MRKLDNRGVAAFEFILVFVPLFTLMFAIFDLGRYAITMQSLRTLASAGARAVMINCYTPAVLQSPPQSPSGCTGDPLPSTTDKQKAAPFLFRNGSSSPTVSTTAGAAALTVTASQAGFAMVMPIWGTALNAPSASTQIPF
ncbi:TadE/TadG family type IV pilus assembly protein [Bradyrhizobium genosp. SA-3]|uniref:TadE/TadG family type IV pilus assembly protein n=1 Tax=Bradyrhizobium genosp. SA-3 TaxID=508868 RepID=UPI001FDEA70C|nr:TadE family protein [Bradyrhizobium genosp. SA-3]